MLFFSILALFLHFRSSLCDPDANNVYLADKVLAIERLMLLPGTIDFQVATCAYTNLGPPPGEPAYPGDQTAAQWVRTVFHDFITANVTAGTGGLDASVGFESTRTENDGNVYGDINFIDQTLKGFNLFSSVLISTADFIALGITEAVLSCDPNSPMIQLRAGRIDATGPGPYGVPNATDGINSQLAVFANAGFNKAEMITAVACGHTIGGVHTGDFSTIVGTQATIGTDNIDTFDDTPFVFDNVGVKNYLSGKLKAGGPLVTTTDLLARSDLGIFESDQNATVTAMAVSQTTFENACFPIFEKMINTVPATNPPLSAPIGPRKFITIDSHLDLTSAGVLTYSGTFGTYGKTAAPTTVSYEYGTSGGGNTGPKTSLPGAVQTNIINSNAGVPGGATKFPFFGNVTFYNFSDPIYTPTTNSLIVEGGVFSEPINLNLFVVPSLSYQNSGNTGEYLVRAAILTSLWSPSVTKLNATLYYPTGVTATAFNIAYKQFTQPLTYFTTLGSYTIFSGTIIKPTPQFAPQGGGGSHIDVSLGTTLRSVKADAGATPGNNVFIPCSASDFPNCP